MLLSNNIKYIYGEPFNNKELQEYYLTMKPWKNREKQREYIISYNYIKYNYIKYIYNENLSFYDEYI